MPRERALPVVEPDRVSTTTMLLLHYYYTTILRSSFKQMRQLAADLARRETLSFVREIVLMQPVESGATLLYNYTTLLHYCNNEIAAKAEI